MKILLTILFAQLTLNVAIAQNFAPQNGCDVKVNTFDRNIYSTSYAKDLEINVTAAFDIKYERSGGGTIATFFNDHVQTYSNKKEMCELSPASVKKEGVYKFDSKTKLIITDVRTILSSRDGEDGKKLFQHRITVTSGTGNSFYLDCYYKESTVLTAKRINQSLGPKMKFPCAEYEANNVTKPAVEDANKTKQVNPKNTPKSKSKMDNDATNVNTPST